MLLPFLVSYSRSVRIILKGILASDGSQLAQNLGVNMYECILIHVMYWYKNVKWRSRTSDSTVLIERTIGRSWKRSAGWIRSCSFVSCWAGDIAIWNVWGTCEWPSQSVVVYEKRVYSSEKATALDKDEKRCVTASKDGFILTKRERGNNRRNCPRQIIILET